VSLLIFKWTQEEAEPIEERKQMTNERTRKLWRPEIQVKNTFQKGRVDKSLPNTPKIGIMMRAESCSLF
jgi:hypothetical protein